MKKKIVSLCLCVALLAVAVIGGTLAYFTDTQDVTNTFSFSKNVTITLDENDNTKDDGSRTETGNDYKDIYPSQTVTKDPIVHVADDSADCYVRAFVTVNNKAALDAIFAKNGYALTDVIGGHSEKWAYVSVKVVGDTRVYELRYTEVLEAEDDTEAIFLTVTFPADLTEEQITTLEDLSIVVKAEAVQSAGFEDYTAAWTAIDAETAAE